MPIKFNIAVEDTEKTKKLEKDLASVQHELLEYKRKYHDLELKYIGEVSLNSECIDLLNENGIAYRNRLSRRERHKR